MYTADEILHQVNAYIDHLPYDRKPESLYAPIKYVLSLGGKRIRPILMMLSYNLYKDDPECILGAACAIETYHNYTLLHDDLMDNAPIRRGHQTVHAKWDANTAILSGDSMLVTAYQQMLETHNFQALELFTETALEIGEGQQYDMDFETRMDVTEEEYIEMIRLKTSVLLACAMKIGAILAGATDEDANNLYRFGEQIGLAFQLQDDYLDVYGDTEVFGKAIGGDITSNKKTYMLINAINRANDKQREELGYWLSATDFDAKEKIDAVTRLYDEIGIDRLAQQKIEYYFEQSRKYLDAVNVPEERKTELRKYAAEMMKRRF
ncbi:MAG: polyprenyl synthetase family protein [Prevotella sp.]|nr:polyprenyl synthetase family protein [Prevotella sp.]